MKYKQSGNSKIFFLILVICAIILYFIIKSFFSFVSFLALPISLFIVIIAIILFFASYLQWYEIKDNEIIGRQLTKLRIPFNTINKITLLKTQNHVRMRSNPFLIGNTFKDHLKISSNLANLSNKTSKTNLEDLSNLLNNYNRQTTLAKLKLYSLNILIISTNNGEFRIMPYNIEEFLFELNQKYKNSQNKKLPVIVSQIHT